ncbi:MAG: VOC family protein [Alphaproteobacteria bacterium]|nr:VOC family protein [Alphaproteobacteria bacterium]
MHTAIAGLDHVIIGVRDLERARIAWTRLGFTLSPPGRHIGQGTANYCIMFPSDYLEILGVVDPSDFVQHLDAFLAQREGAMASAFAPSGSPGEVRSALLDLGLHPSEPRPLGRQLELPEGTVVPRFSLISLPPDETPGLECFICAHLTPELMRRPEWLRHANGACRLKGVHVLVENTAGLLRSYDRLFGIQQVTTTDAVASIHVGRHRIIFSTPDDFLAMHPALDLDGNFPLPGIVSLELAIENRDRSADYLTQWHIPFDELPDGSIVVPASEANGVILFFSEE